MPLRANIPVNTVITVPIRMDLPVSTEYHLQAVIPVEISLPPKTINAIKNTLDGIEKKLR